MTGPREDSILNSVAIIGMAGRFPQAPSLADFWRNLAQGVEAISFFSEQELLAAGLSPAKLKNPNFVRARHVLENVEFFDAAFFGYTARAAALLDPQQRVFLELAFQVLESAGYDAEAYQGAIGVFAGSTTGNYLWNNVNANDDVRESTSLMQKMVHNDKDFLATRIAYELSLRGPAVTVQTACSTALVCLHLACQSLFNYECDMAMAGGVSITVPQISGHFYQEGGIISPDGHCRAFDERAQGCIGGDGAGIVLLKRLKEALDEGDHIYAVVRGSAINNDGSQKVGFTAPSVEGQARVITMALAAADVSADSITYVEAHGTGTPLGDPIEVAALTRVFRAETNRKSFCGIGSVKTNIGHLDAAAGAAGLIKTVLALQHKQLPPTLHFQKPNPRIDFEESPLYVNATLRSWEAPYPRRAGVSSFGIGGTNAHVILEEAPVQQGQPDAAACGPCYLLPLSARTSAALERMKANLLDYLLKSPESNLSDVAYTLQTGRRSFPVRYALVSRNREETMAGLTSSLSAGQGPEFSRLSSLAQLWLSGNAVDWRSLHRNHRHRRLPLPVYPFERQRHWIEPVHSGKRAQPEEYGVNGGRRMAAPPDLPQHSSLLQLIEEQLDVLAGQLRSLSKPSQVQKSLSPE